MSILRISFAILSIILVYSLTKVTSAGLSILVIVLLMGEDKTRTIQTVTAIKCSILSTSKRRISTIPTLHMILMPLMSKVLSCLKSS